MTNGKNSEPQTFLLYKNHYGSIIDLEDDEAGRVIKAIYSYVNNLELDINKKSVEFGVFKSIKNQIDFSAEQYKKKCETNRKIAQNRWNKVKSEQTHANACKRMHSDIDNRNDTVNLNENIPIANLSTFPKENEKVWGTEIVQFNDFDFDENEEFHWNNIDPATIKHTVREFQESETKELLTEIRNVFKEYFKEDDFYFGIDKQILDIIIGELQEQKAKGKFIDADDFETMKRFIKQKRKPEQMNRFMKNHFYG